MARYNKERALAVVIPALNEAARIREVIIGVAALATPIVVDDGSLDETAFIAEGAGAIVVRHPFNRGYDAALESGLFKAIALGFDFAITLDGDGQHSAQTVSLFKEELTQGADLVLGVRDKHQRCAESVFGHVASWLWKIEDPLCGMKGYKLAYLEKAGYFDSYKSIGTEFAIRAARSGLNIASVSVPTTPRIGVSKFGSGLRPNLRILRALLLGVVSARRIS